MFQLNTYIEPDFTQKYLMEAPDCTLVKAPHAKAAPKGFHATSIYPEYFKINGTWHLAKDTRMDAVAVWRDGEIKVVEFRNIKENDLVVTGRTEDGSEGIYVHADCFTSDEEENAENVFSFRRSRNRETSFTYDYERLVNLLKYEKEHGGYVVWVLGPACSFDVTAREIMSRLIAEGYCQALLAGNALATHDLEGAYLGTALGCDIRNQKLHYMGHYNHLETINAINTYGSIPAFIQGEGIDNGIIYSCVASNVPFVLNGSIRDDGPGHDRHRYGHDAAHHRHRQHDADLPRACGRHHPPRLLLHGGFLRLRRKQTGRQRQPVRQIHRHERAGLYEERGERARSLRISLNKCQRGSKKR